MNNELLRIALPKLFLWSDPARFQEYPAALARAEADRTYSRLEVERELFDILPTLKFKGGIPRGRRADGIINTFGLERSGERYRINGVNLLSKEGNKITPTQAGLELGELYRNDPNGAEWSLVLAQKLLLRVPRIRLLIGLLLHGYRLKMSFSGFLPTGPLALIFPDETEKVISQRNCSWFNELLSLHSEMALGPCWRRDLKIIGVHGSICWEGVQGKSPSTNNLPTALKKALLLFFYVNLFSSVEGKWQLEGERLRHLLGDDVADSFGIEKAMVLALVDEEEAFIKALGDTIDASGFVIVSRLADQFGALLNVPFQEREAHLDSFIRKAMYYGELHLLEHHPGQPRMGRGLFGKNNSRMVRLDFHPNVDNKLNLNAFIVTSTGKNKGGKQ